MALRVQQYKIVFAEQRSKGTRRLARAAVADAHPEDVRPSLGSVRSAARKASNTTTGSSSTSRISTRAQAVVHEWLESFKEFPPRQKAASFTVDQIVEKLMPKS